MDKLLERDSQTQTGQNCLHCGLTVPKGLNSVFCCSGCEAVYHVIRGHGLLEYYQLRTENSPRPAPVAAQKSYSFFDDEQFASRYISSAQNACSELRLRVDGMHCAACVWLIEKLPEVVAGVQRARANFSEESVSVRFDASLTSPSSIARALDALGYKPHPLERDSLWAQKEEETRRLLLRLGVAAVSAGNTMMIAISLYQGYFSGIEQKFESFLQWMSLLTALPAVGYSALPFYRAAWASIRTRALHIDLPISLAILAGFLMSFVNLLLGSLHIYFDSITMLVFLLLLARFIQRREINRSVRNLDPLGSVLPLQARRISDTCVEEVYCGSLQAGERVFVSPGELVPADARVCSGEGYLDTSFLTGESRPVKVAPGAEVLGASRSIDAEITLEILVSPFDSRVGRLIEAIRQAGDERAPLVSLTDRLSGYFVVSILCLAALSAAYWYFTGGIEAAFETTLALLIVACPCALGLSAPLTLGVSAKKAAGEGIFVRSEEALERIEKTKSWYFDKTGTLTLGRPSVERVWYLPLNENAAKVSARGEGLMLEALEAVSELESGSRHPLGAALLDYAQARLREALARMMQEIKILPGSGVQGITGDGDIWQLGSWRWLSENSSGDPVLGGIRHEIARLGLTPVLLKKNGEPRAVFALGDGVRAEAKPVLESLRKRGYKLRLISGDVSEAVLNVGRELGFSEQDCLFEQTPESKAEVLKQAQSKEPTAMVGDGVNDAAALRSAGVGLGFSGGAELCLLSADVFFSSDNLTSVETLILGTERSFKVIKLNFGFSLIYNLFGAGLAVSGVVTPLIAALLMPLSSLTVVLSSLLLPSFKPPANVHVRRRDELPANLRSRAKSS